MIVSLYLTRRFRAAQDAKTNEQGLQVFVGRVKFCEGDSRGPPAVRVPYRF